MGRLIDADALIEKCGEWYTEEGTEEGFIGTLKNLLDSQPTVTPDTNDGWILCSERMPEEEDSIFAKLYGTDKWRNVMFRKYSKYVGVTVEHSDGKREVRLASTIDGKWLFFTRLIPETVKVIAWRHRINPYMGEA